MENKQTNVRKMVLLAVLSAMAYLVMVFFKVPVVLFLKYEPKDVIITIGSFLYGPLSGLIMSAVVSLIEMVTVSDTGPIGCLMNMISTCAFVLPAAIIYQRRRNIRSAVAGLICGVVTMVAIMLLWNYLITPLYMGFPRETVAQMLLPAFLPFNLLKGGLNTALTLLLYKPFFRFLKKSGFTVQDGAASEGKKNTVLLIVGALFLLATCVYLVLVMQGVL